MTDKAPAPDDKLSEAEAESRFKHLVNNLVNTPHKPHKAKEPKAPATD